MVKKSAQMVMALIVVLAIALPTIATAERPQKITDPQEWVDQKMTKLTEQLALSTDQQTLIRPHYESMIAEITALQKAEGESGQRNPEMKEAMDTLRDRYHDLIAAELTESQQEQFQQMLAEEKQKQDERRQGRSGKKGGGRGGSGGPGGRGRR